ncbi:MAG: hypothetical protein ACTSQI_11760 [Candidatus Helarchaeota archaeon]
MNSSIDLQASHYARQLKKECKNTIPSRRKIEIILLTAFLIMFTITAIYLWINELTYDYWFYIFLGVIVIIIIAGYGMDRKYRVDWKYYFLKILKELHSINTIELSECINDGQPFLGANLGNCEKFLKIANSLKKEEAIDIVIRGSMVYLKGYEPPAEVKESQTENKDD